MSYLDDLNEYFAANFSEPEEEPTFAEGQEVVFLNEHGKESFGYISGVRRDKIDPSIFLYEIRKIESRSDLLYLRVASEIKRPNAHNGAS